MNENEKDTKVFKTLNVKNVFLPILIGVAVFAFFIYSAKKDGFAIKDLIAVKDMKMHGLLGAISMLFLRDFLYVLRIKLLVEKSISWLGCFIIIVLWEFSSCVTPSVVGGGLVAAFLFIREGIPAGKAMAYVIVTATFDNYFFLIASPFGFFDSLGRGGGLGVLTSSLFFASYILIFAYASIMTFALFVKPQLIKALMIKITSIGFMKKFKEGAERQGDELIASSKILKARGMFFWLVILIITLITWLSRYVILNFLISGFVECSFQDHVKILCTHLVMWVMMLVSFTPGGCGFVEYFFNSFYKDLLAEHTIVISILWRVLTYYVYLIAGALILPRWSRNFKKSGNIESKGEGVCCLEGKEEKKE